ncbi:MAG: 15.5 kDa unknown protein [Plant associated caulimovirus 1]|nr:MAG: 15.5 kDa unknown protein [Plant associated caulimovirus 1]
MSENTHTASNGKYKRGPYRKDTGTREHRFSKQDTTPEDVSAFIYDLQEFRSRISDYQISHYRSKILACINDLLCCLRKTHKANQIDQASTSETQESTQTQELSTEEKILQKLGSIEARLQNLENERIDLNSLLH